MNWAQANGAVSMLIDPGEVGRALPSVGVLKRHLGGLRGCSQPCTE